MTVSRSPRAFISYSHDSEEHKNRVLLLAMRLREHGVIAILDEYETSPPQGWPRWMQEQLDSADYVITICTESYKRRMLGQAQGLGANWEGALITQKIYDERVNCKYIPVLFSKADEEHVPSFLRGVTRYVLDEEAGWRPQLEGAYRRLYRHLTGQPAVVPPAVGSVLPMPPNEISEDSTYKFLNETSKLTTLTPDIIRRAFLLLDRSRSFGTRRSEIFKELDDLIALVSEGEPDSVLLALKEFLAYEKDRSGETYRLQFGVSLLDNALASLEKSSTRPEAIDIELACLQEKINLFLTGNQIPGGRNRYLESAVSCGEKLLARMSMDQPLARAKCMVLLAEAFKEMAMVEREPRVHQVRNYEARKQGEAALAEIARLDATEDTMYLHGCAYRHLAVTYELEADALPDKTQGQRLYEKWRNYSSSAVRLLEEIGETTVRAYAMINIGSSYTRLADFEMACEKQLALYDESKPFLKKAIALFERVQEHRGIGWAYVHLCETGLHEINLAPERKNTSFQELESFANRAIAALKHGADHLGLGLAYQCLGVILYNVVRETGKVDVKLTNAIRALKEAINYLEQTGYYRGAGEACLWKAQCHLSVWKQNQELSELVQAITELTRGATSTAIAVKVPSSLERLCHLLDGHLRELLKPLTGGAG